MDDYDVEYYEENELCWDDLKIFLKIKDEVIENWSFTWDTAIITTACGWVYWESIIWTNIYEVLDLDYHYIVELIEEEVSDRRKKASVLALLTTRNAIHKYLNDWIEDNFDDVIPN
jgi:NifU-like protein involved in Fe-S cluster formation